MSWTTDFKCWFGYDLENAPRLEGSRTEGATAWILKDHFERVWIKWGWMLAVTNLNYREGMGQLSTYTCSRADKDWDDFWIWEAWSIVASSFLRRLRGGGWIDSFEIRRF